MTAKTTATAESLTYAPGTAGSDRSVQVAPPSRVTRSEETPGPLLPVVVAQPYKGSVKSIGEKRAQPGNEPPALAMTSFAQGGPPSPVRISLLIGPWSTDGSKAASPNQ